MPTLFMDERTFSTLYVAKHNRSGVLKSRENICKLKCNRSLKKKLRKYKLRKDGQEDPDIIDVSQTLINSLRIKSPNSQHFYSHKVGGENRSDNYLTKMVRLKKAAVVLEASPTDIEICNSECKDESLSLTPKSDKDKKQTDAFKLLMDSRNKTIGSNSPGKEKCDEDFEVQEKAENKQLRAKRILSLNRMAEAKGSLKKLEAEEYREENIKRKMEDRTERLKHMIVDMGKKNRKKDNNKPIFSKLVEKSDSNTTSNVNPHKDKLNNKAHLLKTFDLFEDTKINPSKVKKISKEDEDFLKKLSPSIRKQENMLCYFQKVCKESNAADNVIKVKLKSSKRVSKKTNKYIPEIATKSAENSECDREIKEEFQYDVFDNKDNNKKRKRNENNVPPEKKNTADKNTKRENYSDSRPKRITKKPIKFTDDFQLTSSDEELHIFTPKKKRNNKLDCDNNSSETINNAEGIIEIDNCKIIKKGITSKKKNAKEGRKFCYKSEKQKIVIEEHKCVPKKTTKLAPIFVTKPLLDSATIEAKQKFLQSGVPNELKKTSTNQTYMFATDEFQKVVHIQHLNSTDNPIIPDMLDRINTNYTEDIDLQEEKQLFRKLINMCIMENYSKPKFQTNIDEILHNIKKSYPKFPVYRTYHLLKGKSKGEFKDCIYPDLDNSAEIFNNMVELNNVQPDKLNWAEKYKPTIEKQVIGNFESIRELRRWLVTWTENFENSKNKHGSDSSEFYQSDADSRETMKNENNLLIISGNVGTGKTLSVYAVAAELAMKVIEVNASMKRTGKIMLQDLQEATQSHKVDRVKQNTECLQKLQYISESNNLHTVSKKRGRKKKCNVNSLTKESITRTDSTEYTVSQDNSRTAMSLILIDDADIVFDQDDGFSYAISQLIQSSKRPVILVTSSLNCPHLQKFSCLAKIIKMRPFLPRMLGTWLDIMCLVDNNICSPGLGAKTLDLFRGDIRKTINYLQFYITSQKHLCNTDYLGLYQNEELSKVVADDENSCFSWGENDGWGDKNIGISNSSNICNYFMDSQLLHYLIPQSNFYIWWNLPHLLSYPCQCCSHPTEKFSKNYEIKEIQQLNKVAAVLNNVSISDYLGAVNEEPDITTAPWRSFERDSVIDNENFASCNRNKHFINEITWELMIKSVAEAQTVIDAQDKTEINYPSMSMQRERDKVVSRHKTLTNCLNPSTALDRRALALDYWPSCRSICRTEKNKTNHNSKRNNRFCHYLKSLNLVSRSEYYDSLGDSLSFMK